MGETEGESQVFTLTIRGVRVPMRVRVVERDRALRREAFWATTTETKAAGLATHDYHFSGDTRMEAVGWALECLAGEGLTPTAMEWPT